MVISTSRECFKWLIPDFWIQFSRPIAKPTRYRRVAILNGLPQMAFVCQLPWKQLVQCLSGELKGSYDFWWVSVSSLRSSIIHYQVQKGFSFMYPVVPVCGYIMVEFTSWQFLGTHWRGFYTLKPSSARFSLCLFHIWLCVCVCLCAYIYIYIYICTSRCLSIYVSVCMAG